MKNIIRCFKENKICRGIMKVLNGIFIVALGAFILVVFLQRFSNNKISVFNYRMFTVISLSMEPRYVIGDVLIAQEVDPSKIKVGDAISYLGNKGDVAGKIVTHEVVKIGKDENGKYLFRAKGLSNIIEDPTITEEQLYGKVVYKTIILSLIYKIVGTNIGFYLFIIVPLIFIIGYEIFGMLLNKEEKRRSKI